ncbi:DUF928 domain-containing protein [Lyngbya sp. PCC 8106]|uniref:DUF928 domain-containing protein n=1 Tax=Lyngbya sp. (strain PCC 8106) TaxID=313612 RepID=UPI0000EAB6FB|nr:DUF928 domain-containing protein [Lyngbya sp. PCC 8106]EAW33706.1 hypothetical protein L8106_10217 [Lyngbya sp. PCC 8106]
MQRQYLSQLFSQQFISVLVTVSVGLAIIPSLPVKAEKSSSQQTRVSVAFQPPAGQGMPNRTAGGASRTGNNCPILSANQTQLTALVPALQKSNDISSNLTGLTIEGTPTFYFFVPAMAAQEGAFSLKDENDKDIYQTRLPLSGKTGIISVKLPSDVPLKVGQSYRWSFGLVCQAQSPQQQPEVVFLTGEISRVQADSALSNQLQQLTLLEQAAVYAQNGIWFESLGILANLRQNQPNDSMLASKWEELLKSVGLEEMAQQPFID